MENSSALNNPDFVRKYPELFFLLAYGDTLPKTFPVTEETWICENDLIGVDLLYLYGIGKGSYYPLLKKWLHLEKGKRLVILEDDLSYISGWLHSPLAREMIEDPRVHLEWISQKTSETVIERLVQLFPTAKIAILADPFYAEKKRRFFQKIKLGLQRKTTVEDALLTEALYSHQLIVNVLANLQKWPESFFANHLKGKFCGIPAIICGAGPSLDKNLKELEKAQDKALIFAGGSTIAALANRGIIPHFGLALDPNPEEFNRFIAAPPLEMPLIYGTRVEPHIFSAISGPMGYLHSFTGGPAEAYFERLFGLDQDPVGIDLGQEALSVTTLAIAFAVALGCNPIFLNGVDLAYTGMERYAKGILPSSSVKVSEMEKEKRVSEQLISKKGLEGKRVYTLVKWVMESECIGAYAQKHPKVSFINVSGSGLGFPGIPNMSFEEASLHHCTKSYDLSALVHAHISHAKITHLTQEQIQEEMEGKHKSLEKLLRLATEIVTLLKECQKANSPYPYGKMTLFELDFEEEEAFGCFLPHVGPALNRLLERSFSKEEPLSFERQIAKWEHFKEVVEKYHEHLKRILNTR